MDNPLLLIASRQDAFLFFDYIQYHKCAGKQGIVESSMEPRDNIMLVTI